MPSDLPASPQPQIPQSQMLHASCVALSDRDEGVLIIGPSGAGKSSLALMMMGFGARLVADDNTQVTLQGGRLRATPAPATSGLIEARGVGILRAGRPRPAILRICVDLGQTETERLPPTREHDLMGVALALVLGPPTPHLAAALMQFLRTSRYA